MKPKMFTKLVFSIVLLSSLAYSAIYSQQGQFRERIQEEKIAFFTQKLDLTADEAQNFWPVYNEYTDRKDEINRKMQRLRFSVNKNASNSSDEDIDNSLKRYVNLENDQHKLFMEYHEKFLNILSPRKVMILYITENQFKQYLLRKLRDRAGQQGPARRR